jgi:hypothetical protein
LSRKTSQNDQPQNVIPQHRNYEIMQPATEVDFTCSVGRKKRYENAFPLDRNIAIMLEKAM